MVVFDFFLLRVAVYKFCDQTVSGTANSLCDAVQYTVHRTGIIAVSGRLGEENSGGIHVDDSQEIGGKHC